ncbi:unnamed protein product [Adineta ricciae]|uniref:Uncharacterized protein n=1 Tax=Adineta ricciae TaxID=249248 RepID=A0A815I5K4_ADIRI|nr:unnamed protein product [Adineta ricciae]CAF1363694.1 unnamed protein product [Adineta ricciae]
MTNPLRNVREYLWKLNLFEVELHDEQNKRTEIFSTRIYLPTLLLTLSLYILYLSLSSTTTVLIMRKPTQKEFEQLQLKYSPNLNCPCQYLSIPYKEFLNIKVEYYEICSSDFVTQQWIDYLFDDIASYLHPLDFRRSAPFKFQLLRTLCQQSQQVIENNLNEFYSNHLISKEPILVEEFLNQVNNTVELFQRRTISLFENLIKLIQQIISANELLSAIETRFVRKPKKNSTSFQRICYDDTTNGPIYLECHNNEDNIVLSEGIYLDIIEYNYSECHSLKNGKKKLNSHRSKNVPDLTIPGMVAGCLPIESLMHSTLECLFEPLCLYKIDVIFNTPSISMSNFSILKEDLSTKYTKVQKLTKKLFVKQWIIDKSYERYFNYCRPLFCQYTDEQRNSFVHIFTKTVSLFGGLKLFLPLIVLHLVTYIRNKQQQRHSNDTDNNVAGISIGIRLSALLQTMKQLITTINIFNSYSADEHRQKGEILSTRIYVFVLITIVIVLTFYISSEKEMKTQRVEYPTRTQFEELQNNSFQHLGCPCTQISTKYSEFVQFRPTYHQICSSVFVSPLWMNWRGIWQEMEPCTYSDFYNEAGSFFFLLSTYCQSAQETIFNELEQFYVMEYTTSGVIPGKKFNGEITSFIENFKLKIQKTFKIKLNIIRNVIFDNQFLSKLELNVDHFFEIDETELFGFIPKSYDNCTCATDLTCHGTMFFCRNNNFTYVPNLSIGCYIVDSLLLSTTTCFYDQNCINIIKSFMNSDTELYKKLHPLIFHEESQYPTDMTIEMLVDNLFIEKWNDSYDYDNYYNSCKPSFCSYKIEQQSGIIYILAKLVSIYSGLTIILRFLIPNIVRLIRRKGEESRVESLFNRLHLLFQSCKNELVQWNLFPNQTAARNSLQKQILSTWTYLITFTIILSICILYTSLKNNLINVKLSLTNLKQYEQLYVRYPDTLNCPCNEISIKYRELVELIPSYHEVCSSVFVSDEWIRYLYIVDVANYQDFSGMVSFQFKLLKSLCRLLQETVSSSLMQFYSTSWVNNQLISRDSFRKRVDNTVEIFQKSTKETFKQVFRMTREILHGNAILTTYHSNWGYIVFSENPEEIYYLIPMKYNNDSCTCATSLQCVEPSTLVSIPVDGFFFGCYPVEAMLHSSLECLYNKICVDLILSVIPQTSIEITIDVLQSKPKYGINETVQRMIDRLFVDDWSINRFYENYSDKCHPTECTYSFVQNFDILHIVTTILDLYGCLTILLSLFIPFIIDIIFRMHYKRIEMVITPDTQLQD